MKQVDLNEAKLNLVELVELAASGEPITIVKDGVPMVKLTAVEAPPKAPAPPCRTGFMRGQFTVPDDFDTTDEDDLKRMFGLAD
jgi:prevent-host-death family protein